MLIGLILIKKHSILLVPFTSVFLIYPERNIFKEENMILVGMIPGPNELKQHINTFLSTLVRDSQLLYDGVTFRNTSTLLGLTNHESYSSMCCL